MAIYRNVHITFWTDSKVVDDFTPEDRYFYIYLLTNPHTNLCGCYEISLKQMSDELGYNKESIIKLIDRFNKIHKMIDYDNNTKELIVYNWHKYNWTKSPKFEKALEKEIQKVKSPKFRAILEGILCGSDTVSIPYQYGSDTTVPATVPVTDTVTVMDGGEKKSKSVITIILNSGEEYPIYNNDIDKWKSLYPGVDILQELRKMSGWSDANITKRKTKREILPFINRWLAEEQGKSSKQLQPKKNQFNNYQQSTSGETIGEFEDMFQQELNERSGS